MNDVVEEIKQFAKKYLDLEIKPHQEDWYRFIEENQYCLLLAPREHGKSTTFRTWLLWRLCKDPTLRVLIASHKEELANEFARDVIMHLEREDLQRDFGFARGRPWRIDQAFLNKVRRDSGSTATLSTVSKLAGITGKRFDIIVMDDILTVENCDTEARRRRLERWINKELFPALDHNEKRKWVVIGTRKHPEDWYSKLMEMPHWACRVEKLYKKVDGKKVYLWPERFNEEAESILRAQMEPSEFAMEYMNEPVPAEGLRFKREWLRFYKTIPVHKRHLTYYMGVDPSLGSKKDRATYAGIVVIAFDNRPEEQNIYVVDMVRAKLSLAEQEDLIMQKWIEWEKPEICMEAVMVNRSFSEHMKTVLPHIRLVDYIHAGLRGTSEVSKIGRIENIVGWLFKKGKIFLKDPAISPMSKIFIEEEYTAFPEGPMDLMDALVLACDSVDIRMRIEEVPIRLY